MVKLDPRFYKMWPDFEKRFAAGAPSLLNCRSLTVEGDVVFGPKVSFSGDIVVRNRSAQPATLAHQAASQETITL